MAKGRTGFEIIKSWIKGEKQIPVEKQHHNPLDAKIGSRVRFTNVVIQGEEGIRNLGDDLWEITAIWAWTRKPGGQPFADYVLSSEGKDVVLRVMPKQDRGKVGEPEFLLMLPYYPEGGGLLAWGDESPHVLGALTDKTGEFVRFGGEPHEERYFRDLNNVKCEVAIISDKDGDGHVDEDEVERQPFSLWTFRRDTVDEASQPFTQMLHAQMSGTFHPSPSNNQVVGGDKTIAIMRGESVPSANVMVY